MTERTERRSPRIPINVIRRIVNRAQERDAEDEHRLYPVNIEAAIEAGEQRGGSWEAWGR